MKKNWLALPLAVSLISVASVLHAEGNATEGKQKVAACVSCHGDMGNSVVATFPKLAQQHPAYLIKQLQAFKVGTRKNAMMSAMVQNLSDDDMSDIAAYYTEHKIADNHLPPADDEDDKAAAANIAALVKQGSDLYRNGDLTREVSACIACHGPNGEGNKPANFPLIKSQHADYLIAALTDFKTDARSNNPDNMMHMIARKMTDDEIKAVSYYISMMK
jgi:cytochrome c553